MDELLTTLHGATTRIYTSCTADSSAIPGRNDTPRTISACGKAVTVLLARQASLTLTLHARLATLAPRHGPTTDPPVDEALLRRRLADLLALANAKFLAFRFEVLPPCWRELYTSVRILTFHLGVLRSRLRLAGARDAESSAEMDELVRGLDMALIVAGGGSAWGRSAVNSLVGLLERAWEGDSARSADDDHGHGECRAAKRLKYTRDGEDSPPPPWDDSPLFSDEPAFEPPVTCPAPRLDGLSMDSFQAYIDPATNPHGVVPAVFTDLISDWPALNEHPWSRPSYLLSRTFGGRRYVPVEIGRSYVDEDWGQKLIPFSAFLSSYIDPSISSPNDGRPSPKLPSQPEAKKGYLAQHDLFSQVPTLRNDVLLPDYLWTSPPLHPSPEQNKPKVGAPQLNAWFGPAGTITPLHTDSMHNLLCQVVGRKYVRLYPPECTPAMLPRGTENGVDMGNTSRVDLGVAEGWDEGGGDEGSEIGAEELERFRAAEHWDCVLGPGDTLYIPIGWWHYVRSLSVSFSVSFWWN
ncbi:uncharacterized protein DNG_08538 [Cephalotrichum gorgonifer]|uniref:JmjC domain-containing protein n=1 Tax=Cephalotrichum gorgonifer TaxID=2041049 RepID=A0AAE8SYG2_9PEZI|nr:uncharacterized protein DNG_08538 [Cephalotrichum gorgonifer]